MKKSLLLPLIGLALVACGSTTTAPAATTSNTPAATTSVVTSNVSSVVSDNGLGTESAPLTVSAAIAATSKLAEGGNSDEIAWVSGIVASVSPSTKTENCYKLDLKDSLDSEEKFVIYYGNLAEGQDVPVVGDRVLCSGYLKNYNGNTYEMDTIDGEAPVIKTVTACEYAITYTPVNNVTVTGLPEKALSGDTVTFTVEAATGFSVQAVKVNNGQILGDNNSYSFVCQGAATVTVEVVEGTISAPTGVTNYSVIDNASVFSNQTTSYTASEGTINGVIVSLSNACVNKADDWDKNTVIICAKNNSQTITISSQYNFSATTLNLRSWTTKAQKLSWDKVEYYDEANSTWTELTGVTNSSSSVASNAEFSITTGTAEFSSKQVRFTYSTTNSKNQTAGLLSFDLTY